MKARVAGVSVSAPGLRSWVEAQAVLSGACAWTDAPLEIGVPTVLAPRERRRASPAVRLALCTAAAACADAGMPPERPATVFASAVGDGKVSTALLEALAGPDKLVSPTHFHNSVHNAAAGYWSQGVGSHAASTSLAAGRATFGVGLLEALLKVGQDAEPVLLVCYDHPFPEPLHAARPLSAPFAVGLILAPPCDDGTRTIDLEGFTEDAVTPPTLPAMRARWDDCPPARALPLLERLVTGGRVVLDVNAETRLAVRVTP